MKPKMRALRALHALGLLALAALAGCGNLGYYTHLAQGQIGLLRAREPIEKIIADPARDAALRARLARLQAARRWAVTQLDLPDNGSYTSYADLGRPYVVWNVFATPELSLEPKQHCFLLVGCLAYRGYFNEPGAAAQAAELKASGFDVYVGGVPAYSTLGWFDDPVTNTMMHWSDEVLIGTLFHELAHQKLYAKDDTAFNESFAEFVEQEGMRQYLRAQNLDEGTGTLRRRRDEQFTQLMLASRDRLAAIYTSGAAPEVQRAGKRAEFERLAAAYRRLRDEAWGGYAGYDRWFSEGELNNARLLPFGLYGEWVPAFAALFEQAGRDWPRFYASALALSKEAEPQRRERLETLRGRARPE